MMSRQSGSVKVAAVAALAMLFVVSVGVGGSAAAERTRSLHLCSSILRSEDAERVSERILDASDRRDGLCVIVNAPGPELAVALAKRSKFVVQMLHDTAESDAIRKTVDQCGLYGRVSAGQASFERLSVLNAATGRTIRTLQGTENTEEMVHHAGVLLAVINSGEGAADPDSAPDRDRRLIAVDAETGETRWATVCDVSSLILAARGERVFSQSQGQVVCADLETGTERWRSLDRDSRGRSGSPWYARRWSSPRELSSWATKGRSALSRPKPGEYYGRAR